jgi:PleD family two-component response regulator
MPLADRTDKPVILLVEEDTRQRKDIRGYLNEEFRVFEAGETNGALALLEARGDVQGLVTDAHVTGTIEGYELARLVRQRWPKIAVVIISGRSDASSGPVPEGAEFIAKPYLLEQLAPRLREMIEQRG